MTARALALRPGPRLAWASVAGLAFRATLLRPGRSAVRDATGFPPAALEPREAATPAADRSAHAAPAALGPDQLGDPAAGLRVVALPGVVAPLALVRWPAAPGDDAVLLAADLSDGGLRAAVALVAAVVATARRAGAGRLCWAPGPVAEAARLDHAARLLGCARDHPTS